MTRIWFVSLVLAIVSVIYAQEPQKTAAGSMAIEDVVSLSKSHVSDDIIIARLKRNAKPFDLNPDEILELQKNGVSDTVIKYLIDPNYSPPPAASPSTSSANGPSAPIALPAVAAPKPPSDPRALKLPPDPGLYYLAGEDQFLALELRPVVPKQPGRVSTLGGVLKSHIIGSVIGLAAKSRVVGPSAIFFFRLPEKASIDDLALLTLSPSSGRRDLDFGAKPGKPTFPVRAVMQFDSKDIAPGLYRVTVPLNKPGEYLFLILGSGDDKKGLLGKGYDFGVDAPGKAGPKTGKASK